MFSSTAAFDSIDNIKDCTTHHQVFYTPTRHFLEGIALISCSGSLSQKLKILRCRANILAAG
jgi:hypothetical protein